MINRSAWFPILFWVIAVACAGYILHWQYRSARNLLGTQASVALERELHQLDNALWGRPNGMDEAARFRQLFLPMEDKSSHYFIVDRIGRVAAADQANAQAKAAADLFDETALAALKQLDGQGGTLIAADGEGLLGLQALRAVNTRQPGGILVIQRNLSTERARLAYHYLSALVSFALLALIASTLLFLVMMRGVNRRLGQVTKAISRFAQGDGSARADMVGHDPIARLAGAFDNMANRIGQERSNLAESEERLKFALHGSNAGIWDWRIDSGHTYYSPRWKSLLGYGEREVLAHSEEWLKRVHPDDLPRVMAQLNAHMTGGSDFFESEHRLRRKGDDYIWALERGVVLRDERGKPYRMVGALTDITARKEIESALLRSEEAYRSVVNAVTQVIFRCDGEGRLTFLNPAWSDLTGNPIDSSLARPLTDFVAAEDRSQATWLIEAANRGEHGTVAGELRLTTQDGGTRWFSLHARSLGADRASSGIAGLLTDIDPLKKAQDALTRSNKERNTILDLSPDGYVFIDRDRQVVYVNPAFLAMTGLADVRIVGKPLDELEGFLQALSDPAKPLPHFVDTADDVEYLVHLANPAKSILKWLIRHIRDENGQLQAGVIFFRDVTAQMEIDRMKSEFLSTAAHELRTPMASIYGFAELLLAREFDAATQRDLIQRIHRQTKNLTNLVNELLDLARIEARGSKTFKFKDQALAPAVMNTLGTFYVPHETHSLEVELEPDLASVHIDTDKFQQAMVNVLGNALKYSPSGGTILVSSAHKVENGRAFVGISIQDQGIGMTDEQMAHMFDRFYRADTSGAIPGTGLGMCLVKEIMAIFNGQVTVTSEFGHGTEVTLWLPVVDPTISKG
ncbi:PAS domain S-box protein [Parasulfuritortus cantonensis]|nr:PAS domain S-box protein [Parasulfuritortus cantonensis]